MNKRDIKYLFLCPHVRWLEDISFDPALNRQTLLLMPAPDLHSHANEIERKGFGDVREVKNYVCDEEVRALIRRCAQEFLLDRIIAPDEDDILRAAGLRQELGLEGQSYESAIAFRDKVRMKEILAQKGLKVPFFRAITSAQDLFDFAETYGFPLILKPCQATGCQGVQVLSTRTDIESVISRIETSPDSFYQAETFVDGKMYHVDGLFKDGKILCAWPSLYFDPPLNMMEGKCASSYILSSRNPLIAPLNGYAEQVLKAMPTPENTAFHLEFFMPPEGGAPVFCEIASRVGGKGVNQAWKSSFGIDLKQSFVRMQYGEELPSFSMPSSPFFLTGEIWFPCPQGRVEEMPLTCPFSWVKRWEFSVTPGEILTLEKSIERTLGGSSQVEANSEQEMEERMTCLRRWVETEVRISELMTKRLMEK